jgi:DNA-binding FadR family transcriptional regulator
MNAPINLSLFRPAKIGRASEDVALQIEAAIIDGQLQKGERLPSERNLQTLFRTSRGVIREALRALKEKGLLEIKKGARGGAYVKNVELINASEPLALFLKQQKIPVEFLIEFRESIDRTITLLAITRGTAEAKQALLEKTAFFQKLVSEPDLDLEKIAEIDREMNIALVKMAGNPMFEMSMRTIQIGFSSQDQALYEDAQYRFETALNWHETAQQIAAGETLRALSCISYHYVLLQRCLAKRRPQGIDVPVGTAIGAPASASDASAPSPSVFETIETRAEDD